MLPPNILISVSLQLIDMAMTSSELHLTNTNPMGRSVKSFLEYLDKVDKQAVAAGWLMRDAPILKSLVYVEEAFMEGSMARKK